MKSMVTFWIKPEVDVGSSTTYSGSGISAVVIDGKLTQLQALVEHDGLASLLEIEAEGREKLRDLVLLLSFGRHSDVKLANSSIRAVEPPPGRMVAAGLMTITKDVPTVNKINTMPDEELLQRLSSDEQLRRQVAHLNAARNAGEDVIGRIRWAYMILEQEELKNNGYKPLEGFLHLRNGVSHAELDRKKSTDYFKAEIGAPFPDLGNPRHFGFLASESEKLLKEGVRIVEGYFSDRKFWE